MDRKEELILAKQLRACRVSILIRVRGGGGIIPHQSPWYVPLYCGDSTVNRSLIVMCEYIVNKSANGLGGKNRGTVYREKIPQFCI